MKYRVAIGSEEREVELVGDSKGGYRVSVDGRPLDAELTQTPDGWLAVVDGEVLDLRLSAAPAKPERQYVAFRGQTYEANIENESHRARSGSSRSRGDSAGELVAPMPGRVVRVAVAVGEQIVAGTTCVVVEAMKMENELKVSADRKVATVHVREGDQVDEGATLVSFETSAAP